MFNARGKIGQALGAFALPLAGATSDSSGYMSLLCIDARTGAPTVTSRSVRTARSLLLAWSFVLHHARGLAGGVDITAG